MSTKQAKRAAFYARRRALRRYAALADDPAFWGLARATPWPKLAAGVKTFVAATPGGTASSWLAQMRNAPPLPRYVCAACDKEIEPVGDEYVMVGPSAMGKTETLGELRGYKHPWCAQGASSFGEWLATPTR